MSFIKINIKVFNYFGLAACSIFVKSQLNLLNTNNNEHAPKPIFLKDYIPKDATQQTLFLKKYPNFDGRGIKIAIIDSGIDVSAEGLQQTSEGTPKIIDCFDFSESGNVDTSVVREMNSENVLTGLSGRKYKIPVNWKNPSGKWHLGVKSLTVPFIVPKYNRASIWEKIKTMITCAMKMERIKIDCITWFDGEKWRACIIDTMDEEGDLEDAKVLTNFRDEHDYGILHSPHKKFGYCIKVHNEGNIVKILFPRKDHASGTAKIAAANYPNEPERNGLAPGAQIISMSIYGSREPEFDAALKKALSKCIEMKVDIVTFSIRCLNRDDETEQLINEMVKKHNILVFKSAGNSGPFCSTLVKEDEGIQDVTFNIGALVTPKMNEIIYNFKNVEEKHDVAFYSSRGPSKNGLAGIDFIAPGAVVIDAQISNSIKNEGEQDKKNEKERYQGTSASCPNAAGAVACLLSALKANSIPYSHSTIKSALCKSATLPENGSKLDFGHGIIQIDAAFDYCKSKEYKNEFISKSKKSAPAAGNGIFYIHKHENKNIRKFIINFCASSELPNYTINKATENDSENGLPNHIEVDEIAGAAKNLSIKHSPEETENFIEFSKMDDSDKFSINIDSTKLEPGKLHHSDIEIFDPSKSTSICKIPVTVIVPIKVSKTQNYRFEKEMVLSGGIPFHLFIHPESRRKCKVKITSLEENNAEESKLMIQYAVNTVKAYGTEKLLSFTSENQAKTYEIPIQSEKLHEICIHQLGGSRPTQKFKLEFDFDFIGQRKADLNDFMEEDSD